MKGLGPKLLFRDLTETTKQRPPWFLSTPKNWNFPILKHCQIVKKKTLRSHGNEISLLKVPFSHWSQNLLLVCSEACHAPKDSGASTTERTEAEPACISGQTLLSLPYCTCSVGPQQQAWHRPSYLEEAVPTASSAWAPPMCQTWKEAWSFPHPLKPPVTAISV